MAKLAGTVRPSCWLRAWARASSSSGRCQSHGAHATDGLVRRVAEQGLGAPIENSILPCRSTAMIEMRVAELSTERSTARVRRISCSARLPIGAESAHAPRQQRRRHRPPGSRSGAFRLAHRR